MWEGSGEGGRGGKSILGTLVLHCPLSRTFPLLLTGQSISLLQGEGSLCVPVTTSDCLGCSRSRMSESSQLIIIPARQKVSRQTQAWCRMKEIARILARSLTAPCVKRFCGRGLDVTRQNVSQLTKCGFVFLSEAANVTAEAQRQRVKLSSSSKLDLFMKAFFFLIDPLEVFTH